MLDSGLDHIVPCGHLVGHVDYKILICLALDPDSIQRDNPGLQQCVLDYVIFPGLVPGLNSFEFPCLGFESLFLSLSLFITSECIAGSSGESWSFLNSQNFATLVTTFNSWFAVAFSVLKMNYFICLDPL